jgi:hypothetical protein
MWKSRETGRRKRKKKRKMGRPNPGSGELLELLLAATLTTPEIFPNVRAATEKTRKVP